MQNDTQAETLRNIENIGKGELDSRIRRKQLSLISGGNEALARMKT